MDNSRLLPLLKHGYNRFLKLFKKQSDDHNVNQRPTWSEDLSSGEERRRSVYYGADGHWVVEEGEEGSRPGYNYDEQTLDRPLIKSKEKYSITIPVFGWMVFDIEHREFDDPPTLQVQCKYFFFFLFLFSNKSFHCFLPSLLPN